MCILRSAKLERADSWQAPGLAKERGVAYADFLAVHGVCSSCFALAADELVAQKMIVTNAKSRSSETTSASSVVSL